MAKLLVLIAGALVGVAACASGDEPNSERPDRPETKATVTEPPCVEEVRRSTDSLPPGSPMAVADALVVTAVTESGCAPLDGPLVAFNWFSIADQASYERYSGLVHGILIDHGHSPVLGAATVSVLEVPEGTRADGTAYPVHEKFAFPIYSSAGGFLDMILSPEFQAVSADQQAGARQEDYLWGLQRCLIGCPDDLGDAPELISEGLFVLHIFDYPDGDLKAALDELANAPDGLDVFYGGELVAVFEIEVGGARIGRQDPPWGNGTAVYRVSSDEAARDLLTNPALVEFRAGTTDDMVVLLDGGGLFDG